MQFEERHAEIVKKVKPKAPLVHWLEIALFSLVLFFIGSLYLYLRRGDFDLFIANKVLAVTALFLIGFSLVLSAMAYFWDFLDTKIIYRRHLGVAGFSYGLLHVLVTFFFLRDIFPWTGYYVEELLSVLLGLAALIIFLGLTLISNRYSVHELGGNTWRKLLRYGGYLGFVLVIIHYAVLKYDNWLRWFTDFNPWLPPLSFVAFVFAVLILTLRLILAATLMNSKNHQPKKSL